MAEGAGRVSTPRGERRKPGSFNRSRMVALLKTQARTRKHGVKPEAPRRWTSIQILAVAGQQGMLSVARSRKLCGYRWASASKYEPGCGVR
jgi:hypothetical protein